MGSISTRPRMTTTRQINNALSQGLVTVKKAECKQKSSLRVELIKKEEFVESLEFLNETGVFADCVDWRYERKQVNGEYIIESGRMNGYSENIVMAYLILADGASSGEVEKILRITESED